MADSTAKKGQQPEKSSKLRFREVNRGTQDELSVLGMIIDENPILKQRILEKIRMARAVASMGSSSGKIQVDTAVLEKPAKKKGA